MLLIILVALTLLQGGSYEGEYQNVFFADAFVNVSASNSVFDNCTGKVVVIENANFSIFHGEIYAKNSNIFIKDSNVSIFCENSTVTALKNRLDIKMKNCKLKASMNEIVKIEIIDSPIHGDLSLLENLPLIYSYNGKDFWTFVGNYWPNNKLSSVPRDADGDGLSDSDVCPKMILPMRGEAPLFCEPILVESIEKYTWHEIKKPPLSIYRVTEKGLEYVGPYVGEEEEMEDWPKIIALVTGIVFGFILVLWIYRRGLR